MAEDQIRIGVVGAGLAGLALALALGSVDQVVVDIYESAPELSEIGAGINLWPRTWDIMHRLGLADTLIPLLDHYPDRKPRIAFEVRKADQRNGFKVTDIVKNGGALRIHRADLQRSFISHLPPNCRVHLSHKLVDYTDSCTENGPVLLKFADGSNAECDLLVGADGIKSTVRRLFLNRLPNPEKYLSCLDPVWSGTVAYRGMITPQDLQREYPGHRALNHSGIMYVGKHKHAVVYPVSGGKFINIVSVTNEVDKAGTIWTGPWSVEVPQKEMFEQFSAWEEEFQALLRCIKRPTKWPLQIINHLDTYAKGHVALIGDAAHAMVPHQGAGAGQGIEDAYILAALVNYKVSSKSQVSIRHILETYSSAQVPRANSMSAASLQQGYLTSLTAPGFEQYHEGDEIPRELLVELFDSVAKNWDWTASSPEEDRMQAIAML